MSDLAGSTFPTVEIPTCSGSEPPEANGTLFHFSPETPLTPIVGIAGAAPIDCQIPFH